MSITLSRGKRGTSIHAKGADAQALFDALTARPAGEPKPQVHVDPKIRAAEARALQDQVQYQSMTGGL